MKKIITRTVIFALCILLVFMQIAVVYAQDAKEYTIDFEEKASGLYANSISWSYYKDNAGLGNNKTSVLKFAPNSRDTFLVDLLYPLSQSGKFEMNNDCEYEVEFSYYSTGLGSGVIGDLQFRDSTSLLTNVKLEIDKKNGTAGVWKKAKTTLQPLNADTNLKIGLSVSGQYSKVNIYFDDFVIIEKKAELGEADRTFIDVDENVITFDGANKPISSSAISYFSGAKHYVFGNSTTMLKFNATSTSSTFRVAFFDGLDSVKLNAGSYYTIKFKYYNPSQNGKITFSAGVSDEGKAWDNYQLGDSVSLVNNTDGWIDGEVAFSVLPKKAESNFLFIQFNASVLNMEVYLDNFEIIEERPLEDGVIDVDFETENIKLTSTAWSWYLGDKGPVCGNNSTILKFTPGEQAKMFYTTKLCKGKRNIPISNGKNYSLSFDYYCDSFDGALGEFYIKNKSGENLFNAALEVSADKGTDGNWKRANFVFNAVSDDNDYLQIMMFAKEDNTSAEVYFDNFKLVCLDSAVSSNGILKIQMENSEIFISEAQDDFEGYLNLLLQFDLEYESLYGNNMILDIYGDKYRVLDYGMIYRPQEFSFLGKLNYKVTNLSDDLISKGYDISVVKSGENFIRFRSSIINLRGLYTDMRIDIRPYVALTPVSGKGTVYAVGDIQTTSAREIAENNSISSALQYLKNTENDRQ